MPGLVRFYTGRIKQNAHLNAFIELFEEEALERACSIQEKINKGTEGKLAGMVLGLKDNICFKGHIVSASSRSVHCAY